MVAEFRVYTVRGSVRAICHYKGDKLAPLDTAIVNEAATKLYESDGLDGCGLDFAVVRKGSELVTALIEVNEGFSLGAYDGISADDYTDMLTARWEQLMKC
jgi:ATP-grasp domain, R2K clade family 2